MRPAWVTCMLVYVKTWCQNDIGLFTGCSKCIQWTCLFLQIYSHRKYKFEPPHDKSNKMTVRPAKIQISLGMCPVWSESLLYALWVAKGPSFLHADSVDSDQTGRMLIWVFAWHTSILLVLSWGGSFMGAISSQFSCITQCFYAIIVIMHVFFLCTVETLPFQTGVSAPQGPVNVNCTENHVWSLYCWWSALSI